MLIPKKINVPVVQGETAETPTSDSSGRGEPGRYVAPSLYTKVNGNDGGSSPELGFS